MLCYAKVSSNSGLFVGWGEELLTSNLGVNMSNCWVKQQILRYDMRSTTEKKKKTKGNFTKLKLCASQDNTKKVKRQATEWKKIYSINISDKGLISRIYLGFLKLHIYTCTIYKQSIYKNGQKA